MQMTAEVQKRPVFLLLTSDLSLAARLQGRVAARMGARVLWCATLRDVREHLETEIPAGLLVEIPRRSARMLRDLRALAALWPVVAITRPADEPLAWRCLAAGAVYAVPRLPVAEEALLDFIEDLASRQSLSRTA